MAGKYWCFHCGAEADSPAEIVHADDCRSQTNIYRFCGHPKIQRFWCDKCGEHQGEKGDCPWCNRELQTIYC